MIPEGASWSVAGVIPGLSELWVETRGDPGIGIAILDGPVDLTHPSLRGADLRQLETLVSGMVDGGPAARHGTHVASLIFGQPGSTLEGVAPRCRGVILPIFGSADGVSLGLAADGARLCPAAPECVPASAGRQAEPQRSRQLPFSEWARDVRSDERDLRQPGGRPANRCCRPGAPARSAGTGTCDP
jgi:hypothetical protein